MTKIWWVEDYLSGNVLENRHYTTQEEAVAARERLGYGMVKSFDLEPGQFMCPNAGKCRGCD